MLGTYCEVEIWSTFKCGKVSATLWFERTFQILRPLNCEHPFYLKDIAVLHLATSLLAKMPHIFEQEPTQSIWCPSHGTASLVDSAAASH